MFLDNMELKQKSLIEKHMEKSPNIWKFKNILPNNPW